MKTVEKTVDEKLAEANTEMDKKMDEADKFLDSKREGVVQAVTEAGQKVNETSASAQTSLLGKAKGFLKCKLKKHFSTLLLYNYSLYLFFFQFKQKMMKNLQTTPKDWWKFLQSLYLYKNLYINEIVKKLYNIKCA